VYTKKDEEWKIQPVNSDHKLASRGNLKSGYETSRTKLSSGQNRSRILEFLFNENL